MRRRVAGWVLALTLATGPTPVWAHAILIDSTPPIGATIPAGDVALHLRFNSRVDRARSRLTLIRADRSTAVIPIDPTGTDDVLIAHTSLPAGPVTLRWQVLAIDGHITRGDIPLSVQAAK